MVHTSCIRQVRFNRHAYGLSCSCNILIQDELVVLHHWFRGVSPRTVKQQICTLAEGNHLVLDTMDRYHEHYYNISVNSHIESTRPSPKSCDYYLN